MHLSFRYLTTLPLIALVRIYQVTIGPFLTGHCRFQPTCSVYALEALKTHGPIRGSWLAVRRILRCHPFGGAGYDPVPESKCKSRDCSTHTS
ncbi:MAG TPA: membrane protein insertion efficiency factor YidD [Phycisphaerales bacterium]|nr:membrane protein insertion efficiency factor YidD [Phycisphaerales bacterium]